LTISKQTKIWKHILKRAPTLKINWRNYACFDCVSLELGPEIDTIRFSAKNYQGWICCLNSRHTDLYAYTYTYTYAYTYAYTEDVWYDWFFCIIDTLSLVILLLFYMP